MDFIQSVISRMNSNSFVLKGWGVSLISVLLALTYKETALISTEICYFATIIFWGLDAYYLSRERMYRALYDKVRIITEDKIDFSMSVTDHKNSSTGWWGCIVSKTILPLYLGIIIIIYFLKFVIRTS